MKLPGDHVAELGCIGKGCGQGDRIDQSEVGIGCLAAGKGSPFISLKCRNFPGEPCRPDWYKRFDPVFMPVGPEMNLGCTRYL
jgi:hypothetical protein